VPPRTRGPHKPATTDDKRQNETIQNLKAKVRRLEKLLKEARRHAQDLDSVDPFETNEPLPGPKSNVPPTPPGHVCSACASKEVKVVDFVTHQIFFCTSCNHRKSIKKEGAF
jgi:hypothetical protein